MRRLKFVVLSCAKCVLSLRVKAGQGQQKGHVVPAHLLLTGTPVPILKNMQCDVRSGRACVFARTGVPERYTYS